jgi:hypothetical protein
MKNFYEKVENGKTFIKCIEKMKNEILSGGFSQRNINKMGEWTIYRQ